MLEINVKDARRRFKEVLDRVAAGEEVVILRRNRPVARLVPPERAERQLPSLVGFRGSLRVAGSPLGEHVTAVREEERR